VVLLHDEDRLTGMGTGTFWFGRLVEASLRSIGGKV
jgi:hypothetical protein